MKNKRKRRPGALLMGLGLILLLAALIITGYNLFDEQRADRSTQALLVEVRTAIRERSWETASMPSDGSQPMQAAEAGEVSPDPETAAPYTFSSSEMPAAELDGAWYVGMLEIPTLELSLPVMSSWSYENLRLAPCRYAGSAYEDSLVIAAHNYRAHFGTLKNLSPGDPVIVTDMDGNRFYYEAAVVEVLEAGDVEDMLSEEWALSLFTCTYGGQTRLTVRCGKTGVEMTQDILD